MQKMNPLHTGSNQSFFSVRTKFPGFLTVLFIGCEICEISLIQLTDLIGINWLILSLLFYCYCCFITVNVIKSKHVTWCFFNVRKTILQKPFFKCIKTLSDRFKPLFITRHKYPFISPNKHPFITGNKHTTSSRDGLQDSRMDKGGVLDKTWLINPFL